MTLQKSELNIHRSFYTNSVQYTFFSGVHGMFLNRPHTGTQANLNNKTGLFCVIPDNNGINQ